MEWKLTYSNKLSHRGFLTLAKRFKSKMLCKWFWQNRAQHTSESELEELEEEDDESLELSEAMPVDSCRSTLSARAAISGRSCFRILEKINL